MKKILFAGLVLLVAGAAPARAGDTYDAYTSDIEPWGFGKTQTGIVPEFFRFLAAQTGVSIQVDVRPDAREIDGLRNGDNALALIFPGPGLDLIGLRICEPVFVSTTIAYRKSDAPKLPTLDWLQDRTVGELRSGHTLDRLQDFVTYHTAIIDTQAQGVSMVADRRIDATVCVHPGCLSAMKDAKLDPALFGEIAFTAGPMAIYVSRTSKLSQDLPTLDKLRAVCNSPAGKAKMAELLSRWD
jgi:polar amino acid transport system substrate-binding protein